MNQTGAGQLTRPGILERATGHIVGLARRAIKHIGRGEENQQLGPGGDRRLRQIQGSRHLGSQHTGHGRLRQPMEGAIFQNQGRVDDRIDLAKAIERGLKSLMQLLRIGHIRL